MAESYLGNESLEETGETFVAGHVGENAEAALGVLKVAVLDTSLDNIERGGDDERSRGTSNGGDKVLEPSGLIVILQVEEVLLGKGRTTEELVYCQQKRSCWTCEEDVQQKNQGRFWQPSSPNHGKVQNPRHQ